MNQKKKLKNFKNISKPKHAAENNLVVGKVGSPDLGEQIRLYA